MQFTLINVKKFITTERMHAFYRAVDHYFEREDEKKVADVYAEAMRQAGLAPAKMAEVVQKRDEIVKGNMRVALVLDVFGDAVDAAVAQFRSGDDAEKEAARILFDSIWTRQADDSVEITFSFYSREEANAFNNLI